MTVPSTKSSYLRRCTSAVVSIAVCGRARRPTLAILRQGVRSFPGRRAWSALAFYAGEALARERGELKGRLRTGSSIRLLAADHMHRHIYFYGEYERATTRFLQSIATQGWTFLDVGANAGYYSLLALDLGGPTSSIHAFEPNPELLRILERSAYCSGTIRVIPAACGAYSGTVDLQMSPDETNTGLSTVRTDILDSSVNVVNVPMLTLDEYCQEHGIHPNVIKVDVEGHELAVLKGATKLLREGVPHYIVCEFEPARSDAAPLVQTMAAHGYEARTLTPQGLLRPFEDDHFQNIVFTRAE